MSIMIERSTGPFRRHMTVVAIFLAAVTTELTAVYILVARRAFDAAHNVAPEGFTLPVQLLLVTGDARLGLMRAGQAKPTAVVIFHGERCRREAVHAVAMLALSLVTSLRELAPVHILVAIRAVREPALLQFRTLRVALVTCDLCVKSQKRKPRDLVVEFGLIHFVPAGRLMTFLTAVLEFPFVNVLMARRAVSELQTSVCDKRPIARLLR